MHLRACECAGKLELIAKVNRTLNKQLLSVAKSIKDVFEALEKINEPTLQLVAPSYYLLRRKLQPVLGECRSVSIFRSKLRKYLDDKFWSSINALHWITCFLDPTFKNLNFITQTGRDDAKFKRDLSNDLDEWILAEMARVEIKIAERRQNVTTERYATIFSHGLHL